MRKTTNVKVKGVEYIIEYQFAHVVLYPSLHNYAQRVSVIGGHDHIKSIIPPPVVNCLVDMQRPTQCQGI